MDHTISDCECCEFLSASFANLKLDAVELDNTNTNTTNTTSTTKKNMIVYRLFNYKQCIGRKEGGSLSFEYASNKWWLTDELLKTKSDETQAAAAAVPDEQVQLQNYYGMLTEFMGVALEESEFRRIQKRTRREMRKNEPGDRPPRRRTLISSKKPSNKKYKRDAENNNHS